MKITELTGVLKSSELSVSKAISGLIVCFGGAFDDLLNEKISVFIERANGSNIILANKVLFKDFILNSVYGGEAIQSDDDYATIAVCELAFEGGIFLQEKEEIKISLEDLRAGQTYALYGCEHPVLTNLVYTFEQKSIAKELVSKKIDVKGNDLAIMTLDDSVSDVSFYYENGQVIKFLPFELRTMSVDVDPIQYIHNDGTVQQVLQGRLSLPLVHVDYIEVNKDQSAIVNFVVRTVKDLS